MALKNAGCGTFMWNLLRDPSQTINIKVSLSGGVVSITGFTEAFSVTAPGFCRFDADTVYGATAAIAPVSISNADTFGLPDTYEDDLPLYIGIGERSDDLVLLISRSRPTSVTTPVATGAATDSDLVLDGTGGSAITKAIWVGSFVGQTRSAGAWVWTNAKYIDARFI